MDLEPNTITLLIPGQQKELKEPNAHLTRYCV